MVPGAVPACSSSFPLVPCVTRCWHDTCHTWRAGKGPVSCCSSLMTMCGSWMEAWCQCLQHWHTWCSWCQGLRAYKQASTVGEALRQQQGQHCLSVSAAQVELAGLDLCWVLASTVRILPSQTPKFDLVTRF